MYKVSLKYLVQYVGYAADNHYVQIIHRRGDNSVVNKDRVPVHCSSFVSICLHTKSFSMYGMFPTNVYRYHKRGNNSVVSNDRVMVLVYCTSLC